MSHTSIYNATVLLSVNGAASSSMQVGDFIYFISTTALGGFNYQNEDGTRFLGEVLNISVSGNTTNISVNYDSTQISLPAIGDFIFFAKDKQVNVSGLLGYYASVNFVNNSTKKAELFAIGSEISESSK
jgi:hypothetical protein